MSLFKVYSRRINEATNWFLQSPAYFANSCHINVFYRSAGTPSLLVLLLPSVTRLPFLIVQFRDLILLLAHRYQVIASDLPGLAS